MNRRHYDAIFVGSALEPLTAAALLAKRGFRVLVIGQGELSPSYTIGGRTFPRSAHTFLAAHSPLARRVFAELAMGQAFRRRAHAIDPSFQVITPKMRMDVTTSSDALHRELAREMGEVSRVVHDFHDLTERACSDLDRVMLRDLRWPPESFFERREFARATAHQTFDRRGGGMHLFGELPEPHAFRTTAHAPVAFGSHADAEQLTELARVRLYTAWHRGAAKLDGGEAWLVSALLAKLETYGGDHRPDAKVAQVLLRRNRAVGVELATTGEAIGAGFVIHGGPLDTLHRLVPSASLRPLFERYGEPSPRYFRYTLNVVLDASAVPVGMSRDVFVVRDPARPLVAENFLRIDAHPFPAAPHSAEASGAAESLAPSSGDPTTDRLLTCEVLLERRMVEGAGQHLASMRERVLGALGEVVPFLGDHVRCVDSPHDGRELQDLQLRRQVPPREPWGRGPHSMSAVYAFPRMGPLGLSALPARTPIKRLLLCNRQLAPSLGQEGSFLAAVGAARLVTRSDRSRERTRRGLWAQPEL